MRGESPSLIFKMVTEMLSFDEARYKRLKKAYENAKKDGKTQFNFEGHDFLTDYAKYCIKYLEMKGYGKGKRDSN